MPRNSKSTRSSAKQSTIPGFFSQSSSPPRPTASSSANTRARPGSSRNRTTSTRRQGHGPSIAHRRKGDGDSGSDSSDIAAIQLEPEVLDISDDDDIKISPRRPATNKSNRIKKRAVSSEGNPDESDNQEDIPSGVPVIWKGKPKGTGKRKLTFVDSEEEEIQPKKRKLVKGVRPPTPDNDDLMNEVDERDIVETRLRTHNKKSAYLKNLEKLKRKKRGESVPSEHSESENEEYDETPFSHAKPNQGGTSQEYDGEDEDTFIVEDEHEAIQLPAEFSMNTYQNIQHHIKIICQLFVHLAVQKPEDRREFMEQSLKEEYFAVPLQITRRKLAGMRDAIVTSSVWRPQFKNPLEKYPKLELTELDFAVPSCDACHLGGRISTLIGRVSGSPYDKVTFEPLHDEDSSESNVSADEEEERRFVKREFHLGRFCARRTRVFHKFTHWEYTLFEGLSQEVEDLRARYVGHRPGGRMYIPVAFAGGSKPPDDLSDADGIMAWLDQRSVIDREWQIIHQMMESATNLEVAAKRGDDDG